MVAATANGKQEKNALTVLSTFLKRGTGELAKVLPKHMSAERMQRLALTSFSKDRKLQKCTLESIASSLMIAGQMGLEIGVGGQGYLVPYFNKKAGVMIATFVPGWQGLVDLLNRTAKAVAWTGAVYEGDKFDWELGDSPFVKHKPTGDREVLKYVYAIGRVNGTDWPVIEVWSAGRVHKHRDRYNKVGNEHYSFKDDNNFEMYARKVALLQVLKYLPRSIELTLAMDASYAADSGTTYSVDVTTMQVIPDDSEEPIEGEVVTEGETELRSLMKSQIKGDDDGPELDQSETQLPLVDQYKQMIQGAESEGALRSLGFTLQREPELDPKQKEYLTKLLKVRQRDLLEPEKQSADVKPKARKQESAPEVDTATEVWAEYMQRVVDCDDPDDASGLAADIAQEGQIDQEQREQLIQMLKEKFE